MALRIPATNQRNPLKPISNFALLYLIVFNFFILCSCKCALTLCGRAAFQCGAMWGRNKGGGIECEEQGEGPDIGDLIKCSFVVMFLSYLDLESFS
jgi:hypothetical protein